MVNVKRYFSLQHQVVLKYKDGIYSVSEGLPLFESQVLTTLVQRSNTR